MDKNDIITDNIIDNNEEDDNERTKISFPNSSDGNNKNHKKPLTKSSGGIKSCQLDYLVHPLDRNIAGIFILTLFFTLLAIISGVPIVLCLFVLVPLTVLIKRFSACDVVSDEKYQKIAPIDSFWLNSGHITHCLLYIDKGLSVDQLRDVISTRLLSRPELSRFKSKLVYRGISRTPYWKISNNSDTLEENIVEDEPIVDRKCLRQRLIQLMSQTLPSDKPLWQIRYAFAQYCNQVVLIIRVHQSLSQSGLVTILVQYLSDTPPPQSNIKARFGGSTLSINIFRAVIVGPLTFFLWIIWAFTRRHNNYLKKHKNKSFKSVYWTTIDLPRINRVKQVTRSTLNDLLISTISGSIRAYLTTGARILNPPDLNISMPIDICPNNHTESSLVGVNYVLVTSPIPTNTEGAIPRLWEVRHLMEELKTSADTAVMYGAHYLFSRLLPLSIYRFLVNIVNRNSSLYVSNISGPDTNLSIGSYRLNKVLYFMSAPSYCSLVFNVFSFNGKLYVSISSTSQLIPSAKRLAKLFKAQLNRLSGLLSRRRVPGESRRRRKSHIPYESPLYINNPSPDGVIDLTNKLHEVQYELHKLSEQFSSGEPTFIKRYEELKDEFTGLLFEMRRRKSIADKGTNILINIEDEDDDDNDGELRPPPPRRFSVVSYGRRASASFVSSLPTSSSRVTPPILSRRAMATSPEPPSSPEVAFKSETEC
ncbi:uncharacterized protein LOC128958068 [Oppia nitens]|uniref:uncharacterized protein LOC128958068 n=1 Tax=Oppia nitens TaxID=1686743 RepID=UPI0023DC184A|nr:uncharacterized protein LOC128958068 [Oppia nitens]